MMEERTEGCDVNWFWIWRKEVMSHRMKVAFRSQEGQGNIFSLEPPEKSTSLPTPGFSPVRPVLGF